MTSKGPIRIAGFAAFSLCTLSSEVAARDDVALQPLQAKLFYKGSGRLSENILDRQPAFSGWNTIIGEGDAEESADDLLVIVPIRNGSGGIGNEVNVSSPVSITVKDKKGVVGQRIFSSVLTSKLGWSYEAMWLQNITCRGDLTMEARFRTQVQRATVSLGCGE